jgi:hypothetical protein
MKKLETAELNQVSGGYGRFGGYYGGRGAGWGYQMLAAEIAASQRPQYYAYAYPGYYSYAPGYYYWNA